MSTGIHRLSTDTATVSSSISLNLNVLLRSFTQAVIVLAFMFAASWRLTVLTMVIIPITILLSRVYGAYYMKLSKSVRPQPSQSFFSFHF